MQRPGFHGQPLWPNWIRRIPPKDEIAGSNPARGKSYIIFFFLKKKGEAVPRKEKNVFLPGVGFEPTRTARPADLKSAPLGPSGTQAPERAPPDAHVLNPNPI